LKTSDSLVLSSKERVVQTLHTKDSAKPHYGYYALYIFTIMAALLVVTGVFVAIFVWWLAGYIMIGLGLLMTLSYGISMKMARQTEHSDPSRVLELKGDEEVLDVGCGLGKMTVGVAKRLKTGKVIGIDIWDKTEIPGNSPERAYANAKIEGVSDRVKFRTGNVLSIPFPDNSFDVVTSSSVINNLHNDLGKLKALEEILRVLRPGGRFLMLEPLRDSWEGILTFGLFVFLILPKDRWIKLLDRAGFVSLRYDRFHGMGAFLVEKPIQYACES
jgi:ubiquinone/menaquinone biosynthesis C-methylase UbiE